MRQREAIRYLFLEKREHYTVSETAALLGWTRSELAAEIAASELRRVNDTSLVSWHAVAVIASTQWSYESIEEALGAAASSVLPSLLRLEELRVRIPRYQIVVINTAARNQKATVNSFLARYLLDLSTNEAPSLIRSTPGFREAFMWPAHGPAESQTAA